jgi:SSS family solute:Na+ symporter
VAVVYANALASQGRAADAPWLAERLVDEHTDLRLSAAHALLRLDRRRPSAMTGLDWSIIAVYFAMMLGIGVFYAGRTKNSDDFLLGGRHMKSWMVGLSLFATLLSTLTYLAVPGEMIRHGPVIVMGLASLPLVAWIVGWLLIPAFMRLDVTSAYEILETRFGYGGRLFGSVMFLLLRFFWMAVILYATTDAVIVPLLGWSPAATPWICAVLGVITVIYSSLGGLRAVVLTDVIQTGILLGGALLALGIITVRLGGVTAWWPTQWDPTWTPLRFFDAQSPRTVVMAVLATGLWYVCTAGSDQMAIQRYLATRDVKAARKMFNITLVMNIASWLLLTTLGFALLGFYRQHPEFLSDGATVAGDADKLFPRFIAVGLPMGFSGLVVAGLLAAAMSSLSSGINSSCAVISVDYVSRLRRGRSDAKPGLKETQFISWGIGAVAVLLSMAAGFVPGNLLDVVYRIGNLLVAPLFVLFFLALFVKRASWKATCTGVTVSIAVAVTVAYGELIARALVAVVPTASSLAESIERFAALGVLWIMPLSLVTGVAVGWIGSLSGLGRPAPPLSSTEASSVSLRHRRPVAPALPFTFNPHPPHVPSLSQQELCRCFV